MKRKKFTLEGYGYLEKKVAVYSESAGRIYLPVSWTGKKIAIILLEE